jgi:benzoate-CoA ligase
MTIEFPDKFNLGDYFLYHNLEEGREHKTCLYFEDRTFTYGDVARMSNRVGNVLRELGVRIEERILIALPDSPEFVWSWFGAARIGAVITMVNPLLPAADYPYYLEYTRARVAVIHESLVPAFTEAAGSSPHLRAVLVVGDLPAKDGALTNSSSTRLVAFCDVVNSSDRRMSSSRHSQGRHRDLALHFWFNRAPKGAVHLQHDLPFNTEVFAKRTIGVNEERS